MSMASYTTVTLPKVSGKSCLTLQARIEHEVGPFLEWKKN